MAPVFSYPSAMTETAVETREGFGRPSPYRPSLCEEVRKLSEVGLTDFEIGKIIGVSVMTLHRWRAQYPDFCEAMKLGKEIADERVKKSLYQRAVGYTYASEKVFQYQGEIVRAEIVEHVPPDPQAAMLWLKNRDPERWRDRREVDVSGNLTLSALLSQALDNSGDDGDNLAAHAAGPLIEHEPAPDDAPDPAPVAKDGAQARESHPSGRGVADDAESATPDPS